MNVSAWAFRFSTGRLSWAIFYTCIKTVPLTSCAVWCSHHHESVIVPVMHLQQAFSCWDNEHCAANKTAQPCSMCLSSVQNTQLNWARNSNFPYSHGTNDSCRWLRKTFRGAKLKAEFWGFLLEGLLWRCCAVAGGCFSGPRGSPCTGAALCPLSAGCLEFSSCCSLG